VRSTRPIFSVSFRELRNSYIKKSPVRNFEREISVIART
jgi:hypothetical protein